MQSRTRVLLAAVLAAVTSAACSQSAERGATSLPPLPRAAGVVATFEGRLDAATGALTFTTVPDASSPVASIAPYTPWRDGAGGSGPKNTFELRNGTVLGAGSACPGGSWEGEVILTSFFDTQAFTNVAVELTEVTAGNEACGDDAAYGGMSSQFGLWDYGPIGVASTTTATATRTWRFSYPASGTFVFRGRIMATLAAIPAPPNGATSFEWSPYLFVDPPHSFQHQDTTLAHVVWNGSVFLDVEGAVSFAAVGSGVASHDVGITYPVQRWGGPFTTGASRYEATDAIGLTGDFTACVKFKPGTDPAVNTRKVLVAKGSPVDVAGYGWALTQQHGETQQYGIWYYSPGQSGSYDTFNHPGTDHPESSIFDYVCGGRDGSVARVVNHGRDVRFPLAVGGALPAGLPLVIGAEANGAWPATDAGIYEVIFDSRAATTATIADIVGRAEGRRLYNGAQYWGNDVDARPVVGVDGLSYGFPFGSTAPVSSDGSGLLDVGTTLKFGDVGGGLPGALAGSPASYCVGAEVASANWSAASGCVLGDASGALKIFFLNDAVAAVTSVNQWRAPVGDKTTWAPNSRHTFLVCTPGLLPDTATLYVDGGGAGNVGTSSAGGPQANLTTSPLLVGTCIDGALTNARVGRVFACPTSDPASCH